MWSSVIYIRGSSDYVVRRYKLVLKDKTSIVYIYIRARQCDFKVNTKHFGLASLGYITFYLRAGTGEWPVASPRARAMHQGGACTPGVVRFTAGAG